MFASAFGRYTDIGTFEQLEEGLLYTFAAHIACDAGVLALAGYLVDLVNKDDAAFGGSHIIVGSLE